jgi:hypothetical protein
MFDRHVTEEDVRYVVNNGIIIEEYPDDTPYPSRLILGWCNGRPIHAVVAYDTESDQEIVVTVYEPETTLWTADFTRRRK